MQMKKGWGGGEVPHARRERMSRNPDKKELRGPSQRAGGAAVVDTLL